MIAIIGFIKTYYKPLLLFVLMVAIYLFGHHIGASGVQDAWDKDKAQQAAIRLMAEEQNANKERHGYQASNEVEYGLQKRFSSIDGAFNADIDRLLRTAADSAMPKDSTASGRHNAAACGNGLSRKGKQDILKLMELADLQTAQLQACQQWINKQENIFNN